VLFKYLWFLLIMQFNKFVGGYVFNQMTFAEFLVSWSDLPLVTEMTHYLYTYICVCVILFVCVSVCLYIYSLITRELALQ